jgi:hypothetical protein
MIMTSDSAYSQSLPATRCDHNTGNPLREFFVYVPRALERAAIRRYSIFYTIGNCNNLVLRDSEIWQFAFPIFVASNNCARDRVEEAGT